MADDTVCVARHLNHVALAVNDVDDTLEFYARVFGVKATATEDIPDQGVRASIIRVGGSLLELIQPTDPAGAISKFIERRGEGMHHVCFEVDDLQATLDRLDAADVALVDKSPREGLVGNIAFLHPRSTRGVLIELVDSESSRR